MDWNVGWGRNPLYRLQKSRRIVPEIQSSLVLHRHHPSSVIRLIPGVAVADGHYNMAILAIFRYDELTHPRAVERAF